MINKSNGSRYRKHGRFSIAVICFLITSFVLAGTCFAEHCKKITVTGWGGPESDWRCDRMVDWGLAGKHCIAHTFKIKQHLLTLEMCAPDDVGVDQVVGIKDACAASAATIGAFTADLPAAIATFEICVKGTELGSKLVAKGVRFETRHETHW